MTTDSHSPLLTRPMHQQNIPQLTALTADEMAAINGGADAHTGQSIVDIIIDLLCRTIDTGIRKALDDVPLFPG